jgi:DNA-binding MarR family transcriptional regulator
MAGENGSADNSEVDIERYAEIVRRLNGLGHPLRIAALVTMGGAGEEGASPSTVARAMGTPLSNTSYHVRQLVQNGLLREVKQIPRRGAIEHYYALTDAGRTALELVAALER